VEEDDSLATAPGGHHPAGMGHVQPGPRRGSWWKEGRATYKVETDRTGGRVRIASNGDGRTRACHARARNSAPQCCTARDADRGSSLKIGRTLSTSCSSSQHGDHRWDHPRWANRNDSFEGVWSPGRDLNQEAADCVKHRAAGHATGRTPEGRQGYRENDQSACGGPATACHRRTSAGARVADSEFVQFHRGPQRRRARLSFPCCPKPGRRGRAPLG